MIPTFTREVTAFTKRSRDMEETFKYSNPCRKAIGWMKFYKILQNICEISLLKTCQEQEYAAIDKILVVCAALCNLQPPLV